MRWTQADSSQPNTHKKTSQTQCHGVIGIFDILFGFAILVNMLKNIVKVFSQPYWLKAFSGLCINLSAVWFGLAIITPNFVNLKEAEAIFVLLKDLFFGIVFLNLTALLEKRIGQ